MGETKRRRRRKHRGNAAGIVEARGRTSRPRPGDRQPRTAAERRAARYDRPPTWRSAINRALVAAIIFVAVMALLLGRDLGPALAVGAFMFLIYIPLGYYTDLWIYRRRRGRRERQAGGKE
jgi:hypothetical protein